MREVGGVRRMWEDGMHAHTVVQRVSRALVGSLPLPCSGLLQQLALQRIQGGERERWSGERRLIYNQTYVRHVHQGSSNDIVFVSSCFVAARYARTR